MRPLRLRTVVQLVLAAAVARSAAACGGAISDEAVGPDAGTKVGSPRNEGDPEVPSTTDAGTDAPPDVTFVDAPPDRWTPGDCITGQVDPDPSFCCQDGDPGCTGGGGNGDGLCPLDCRQVCKKFAPDTSEWSGFCNYSASATDTKVFYYCGVCGVGRVPGGTSACDRGATIGERLAMQAYYEAASVVAFRRLADVLAREGAPAALVKRARRAASEERRHARLFARLARKHGAEPKAPAIERAPESLLALALENAREGQVRETYGALVAVHQGSHARDPELRKAFASIADDELAHAELSWELARWFDTRLSPADRTLVANARAEAMEALRDAASVDHDAVDDALGMPTADLGRTLFADLFVAIDRQLAA